MSDVIVSTTNSVTDVTTTDDVTNINITETVVEVSASTAGVQGVPGVNSDPIYVIVRNASGATLPKGAIVYTSGANGTHTQVSLANASNDATSARTLGWVVSDILNNADGLVCVEGYIDGINTQGVTEGAQLYLSGTVSGGFTETKPVAPVHMIYVGVASKASAGNGRVYVKVQNGYELDELHNVKIVSPQNKDLLQYVSGTALWENVAATAVSVGSATNAGTSVYAQTAGTSVYATNAGTSVYATTSGTAVSISGSITKSQVSDFTSGTVASASTAQQAGTAVYATNAGTSVYAETSGTSVYATNAGTSVYAETSGTSVYATTSGTAVSISGTITRSQVSDYASGTVANISGTVTQSQVSGLATALAGKAGLADSNTFSNTNTFTSFTTFQAAADTIPIRIFGANGQSADLFSVNDYLTNTQFEILSDGRVQSLKGIIATVSSTASTPLVVRGTAGQSANLSEWQTSTGSTAAFVDPSGRGVFPTVLAGSFTTAQGAHIALQTTATTNKGLLIKGIASQSANLFEIQDSTGATAVQVNSSGSLVYGFASGSLLSANGRILAVASTATVVPATFKGATSQTANLTEWQSSTGGTVARVDKNGAVSAQYFGPSGAGLLGYVDWTTNSPIFNTGGTAVIGLVVRGVASQSADYIQVQNSSSAVVAKLTSSANPRLILGTSDTSSTFGVTSHAAAGVVAVIRGAASQSANLTEWQDSSGATATRVSASGQISTSSSLVVGTTAIGQNLGQITAYPASTATIGLVVRGAASQSANLTEWQDSSGGTVAYVSSSGFININNASLRINTGGATYGARINVATDGVGVIGQVIRATASQTADLQQWQNSGGTVRARVASNGDIKAFNIASNNSNLQIFEANSGGVVLFGKSTAQTSSPGTGFATMYFRDGTNAGTLKLVVRAGTAGAETTILDNIPQS